MSVVHTNTIKLHGGAYFDFKTLDTAPVSIECIAHALSHICRFCGQTDVFYSVAQHSVLASYHCEDAYAALMHDTAEALLGDVSSPLKALLPEYKALEMVVEERLARQFGIPFPLPLSVKQADLLMLRWEQRDLMQADGDAWRQTLGIIPPSTRIIPWTPLEAKAAFISRYEELRP